jgi:hypothetical protein
LFLSHPEVLCLQATVEEAGMAAKKPQAVIIFQVAKH